MFITFEGLDGSGKTTLINAVFQYFHNNYPNLKMILTREPGGTNLQEAEQIRSFILDKENDIDAMSEALLYLASRKIHLEKIIWPALKDNKIVLCDRFIDSSLAYQGNARKLGIDKIKTLNEIVTNYTKPDLTFFIDLKPKDSLERMKNQRNEFDRLEKESIIFFQDVYDGYLKIIAQEKDRFFILDGHLSKEEMLQKTIIKIKSLLNI
ncbi:MAG: dTMP kinase [Metamycoplasmataceae bacterium]